MRMTDYFFGLWKKKLSQNVAEDLLDDKEYLLLPLHELVSIPNSASSYQLELYNPNAYQIVMYNV